MQQYDPGLLTDWCLSVPHLLLVPLLSCLALRKSSEALAMVISMHVCIGHCPPSGRRGDRAAALPCAPATVFSAEVGFPHARGTAQTSLLDGGCLPHMSVRFIHVVVPVSHPLPSGLPSHIFGYKCTLGFLGRDSSIRDVPADGEGTGRVV